MRKMDYRCLPERSKKQGSDGNKALVNATKIKRNVTAQRFGEAETVLNLRENEARGFVQGYWKAMNGEVGIQFFTRRQLSVGIARDDVDIVSSFR